MGRCGMSHRRIADQHQQLRMCLALAVLCAPHLALAQFTGAHNYDNSPIGVNQVELDYAFAHSNASIDTSLIVAGASLNLNRGNISYTRYFGFLHRLTWVEASVPLAGLGGSVNGTNIHGSATGVGDSSYTVSMLLKGGPARSVAQFENYRPTTTVGLSLGITAPTGEYDPNKVLNLGTDRWSFKPEIGVSHPFGTEQKWQGDLYLQANFFTDNTSYRGKEILRQEPLPGVEGHLSYFFVHNAWVSVDGLYAFRGATDVNGVPQNNSQKNFLLGSQVNLSINDRNTLAVEFAKAVLHENGTAYTGFAVKYSFSWGGGLGKVR